MNLQNGSTQCEISYCAELERLKDVFLEAVRDLAELQDLQMNAVIRDDPAFMRFEDLIQRAREVKDRAKYALVGHMESHCYRKSSEADDKLPEPFNEGAALESFGSGANMPLGHEDLVNAGLR